MVPTKEDFPKICDKIMSILVNQTFFDEKDLIIKLCDSLNLYKITGKNKIIRSHVIDEIEKIDQFFAIIKQIHETKNQKLIVQIIENKTTMYILDLFTDINIKKHGKYSKLYSCSLIDSLLENNLINTMIDNYSDSSKKNCIIGYQDYIDIIITIRDIIESSPSEMCKKYWQFNLVNTLKLIYCVTSDDDIGTKSNCFTVIKMFVDNGYYDQQICDFLLQCLCMHEVYSICGHDDRHNYMYLIDMICDAANELLMKHTKSEISRLFISGIIDHHIIDNLKSIINKEYNFVEPSSPCDGPIKLLNTIRLMDDSSDSILQLD